MSRCDMPLECVPLTWSIRARAAADAYARDRRFNMNLVDLADCVERAVAAVAPLVEQDLMTRLVGTKGQPLFWSNGDPVQSQMDPGCTPDDYRAAVSGVGPKAQEWVDKPHRLVYDLAGEVKRLQAELASLKNTSPT
jgi:hypothetical protein